MRCIGKEYSTSTDGDGPRRTAPELVMACSFPRASVFQGLPAACYARASELLDTRLKESSMRTVNAARTHWATVCEKYGWEEIIPSDDSCRGGKLHWWNI